jgi:ATP-dependent helicase/nuclease subunit B
LLDRLLSWRVVRSFGATHPRIAMLGVLEARLLAFDRVVLAGLVEGTWPPQVSNDPWLSRPMRAAIGLPPPEWRIGLSAHDFVQAFGQREVVLSRALKVEGAPTVAARWLQRLQAVAGPGWEEARRRGERLLACGRALDGGETGKAAPEPLPKPPRQLRPARLSVTQIETLIRDPYATYARHVLRLDPLDPVAGSPTAADRGTIIHDALAAFVAAGIDPHAPDAADRLLEFGRTAFDRLKAFPDVRALWWPRFCRVADWFLGWERGRRAGLGGSLVEIAGRLEWETIGGRSFRLNVRADRIDTLADGSLVVIDYKTGTPPTPKQVASGLSPQLPLEAAMIEAGAFKDVRGRTSQLLYLRLSGMNPPGLEREVGAGTAMDLAHEALEATKGLIDRFEDESNPYRSLLHPKFRRRGDGPYDHLARIKEWGLAGETEEEA